MTINFRTLFSPERQRQMADQDIYYEEQLVKFRNMKIGNLVSSAKYYMTQMKEPRKYDPTAPVYDAVFWHLIIPEMLRRLQKERRESSMMNNTTLGDLIAWLEQHQGLTVKDGFSSPHSDRGDYSELAFSPEPVANTSDMLAYARSALGQTFTGWKGGEFTMSEYTPVYIGEHGQCGDGITPTHFKYWLLTAGVTDE